MTKITTIGRAARHLGKIHSPQLGVDSAMKGSYEKVLQYLLLDSVIRNFDSVQLILDDYLEAYKEDLLQF